jgi:hypothetical protein
LEFNRFLNFTSFFEDLLFFFCSGLFSFSCTAAPLPVTVAFDTVEEHTLLSSSVFCPELCCTAALKSLELLI